MTDDATFLPPGVTMVRATPADADTFIEIHEEAARWLWDLGIRQWRPGAFQKVWLDAPLARGEVYLARRGAETIATIALQWSDEETWGPRPDDAGYVHGLRVRRSAAGQGIGRALLRWAEREVARAGRPYLRLDCIADNPRLCAYYEQAGFTRVADGVSKESRLARFEKPVAGAALGRDATGAADAGAASVLGRERRHEEPPARNLPRRHGALSAKGEEHAIVTEIDKLSLPSGAILTITRAGPADLDAAVAIEEDAASWLRSRGIEPGDPPRPLREIFAETIARGQLYLATVDGSAAAKVALTAEDDLWADLPGDALYAHGLAVRRARAGQQIGRALLRWAERYTATEGKPLLRLDCNADNPALRAYYERAGFSARGEVALPHRVARRYEQWVEPKPSALTPEELAALDRIGR